MPKPIKPDLFDVQDLNFQVRLETCVNNTAIDFTGKKSFRFELMREGVGFGITDISVEVNPSLQPIVEITFKDLYGNTIFDQEREGSELNYGVLFNWPPPKFFFTFKGYLGQPVTWILNLKKYNVNYDPSDNSYEIKTSFVPNQWGFFADMPLLYLLAVKRLKKEAGLLDSGVDKTNSFSSDFIEKSTKAQTLYDLIKIGKQVDVKSKQVTKEYDEIQNTLAGLKTNALGAIIISKLVNFGDTIDGKVNNNIITAGQIDGTTGTTKFTKIQLPTAGTGDNDLGLTEKELKNFASRSSDISTLNRFIILKSKFNGEVSRVLADNGATSYEAFKQKMGLKNPGATSNSSPQEMKDAAKKAAASKDGETVDGYQTDFNDAYKIRLKAIGDNLSLVEKAIQQSIFEANESKLEQLTIGEVFSRTAGDAGYILGRILEEGIKGYENNQDTRTGQNRLIGLNFPMELDPKDSGKEIPATGVGIEDNELRFVDDFIKAVSEGIAENQSIVNESNAQDQNDLKNRISNLEILQSNPYKPYYTSVASNILERSGIAAYVTRSSDPNLPGDFQNGAFGFDRDGVDDISDLANADFENISDALILGMPAEERLQLKDFCLFWDRALLNSGEGFRNQNPETEDEQPEALNSSGNPILMHDKPGSALSDDILNFRVFLNPDDAIDPFALGADLSRSKTVKEFLDSVCRSLLKLNNGDLIDKAGWAGDAYVLNRMRNNSVPYINGTVNNTYYLMVFEGADAISARDKKNSPTDLQFSNKDPDERKFFDAGLAETIYGVTSVEQYFSSGSDNEEAGRITTFNEYVDKNQVFSYTSLKDNEDDLGISSNAQLQNDILTTGIYFDKDTRFPITITTAGGGQNIVTSRELTESEKDNYRTDDNTGFILFGNLSEDDQSRVTNLSNFDILNNGAAGASGSFDIFQINEEDLLWKKKIVQNPTDNETEISAEGLAYTVYQHTNDVNSDSARTLVFGPFIRDSISESGALPSSSTDSFNSGRNQRVFLKIFCRNLLQKLNRIEEEQKQIIGNILGKAEEQKDVIYKQFHLLFSQWNALAFEDQEEMDGSSPLCTPVIDGNGLADRLEKMLSNREDVLSPQDVLSSDPSEAELEEAQPIIDASENQGAQSSPPNGTFRYDFPLNALNNAQVEVSKSIISIDPLYKIKANTTVLNVIQQICTKNNFIFIPIPGNANYRDIKDIYKPNPEQAKITVRNYFHVLFAPTPERRVFSNGKNALQNSVPDPENINVPALLVEFGSPDNQIIKSVSVGTDENKATAESIVNLQRLVDNENQNKTVTTNCSMLSVLEGRSYKARVETLGNAQIYPMQYFFINKTPLFGGLYQIMKVKHTIRSNDFSTSYEGIKIVQTSENYGGVKPITINTLRGIKVFEPQAGTTPGEQTNINSYYNDDAERILTLDNNAPSEAKTTMKTVRNGNIPEDQLTRSEILAKNLSGDKPYLVNAAAKSFDSMISAFNKATFIGKQNIIFTDGYRSLVRQTALKKKYGKYAASPGTSVHGLGLAVDMFWGVKTKTGKSYADRPVGYKHPNYQWFHKNAWKFGWHNPPTLHDDAGSIDEFWHWEYNGKKIKPNRLPTRYSSPWNKQKDVSIIKRYGGYFK